MVKRTPASDHSHQKENALRSERKRSLDVNQKLTWIFWIAVTLFLTILLTRLFGQEAAPNENLIENPQSFSIISYLVLATLLIAFVMLAYRYVFRQRKLFLWQASIIFLIISYVLITILSFNPKLAPNGDNAEYVISAKSMVEFGSVKRLYVPDEPSNSLASLGLPLMLAPIYKAWGVDIQKMKVLILLLSLGAFPILFLLFDTMEERGASILLTVVGATSPYLVSSSSAIMTEVPYFFFSLATLYIATRYQKSSGFKVFIFLLLLTLCSISYITRPVGLSLVLALVCFQLTHLSWSEGVRKVLAGLPFRKLFFFSILLAIGFVAAQWRQSQEGVSQTDLFFSGSMSDRFFENVFALSNVLPQIIFSSDTFLWFRNAPGFELPYKSVIWIALLLLVIIGVGRGVLRKQLMAWYVLFFTMITLLASHTPQERVMVRYFSVVIPFLIYYFLKGLQIVVAFALTRNNRKNTHRFITVIALSFILMVNISGNRYNMLVRSAIYNDYYDSFLRAANWCGQNLDSTSYIMSVKPRIVYLYSGLKGVDLIGDRDLYSEEWAREQLLEIRQRGITHIIVDVISLKTQETVFPLLRNHPDLFRRLDVPGLDEKCTVVEVVQEFN